MEEKPMLKFLKKMKEALEHKAVAAKRVVARTFAGARAALAGNAGEGYVDTAVKILMAVVIGALVLGGLYALFGETVLPTLTERIREMFNYGG
jgi:hypothetical protein